MLHFNLLTRQLAALSTCILNILRVPYFPQRSEGPYIQYASTELADMTSHIEQFCDLLGLDFEAVVTLGRERRAEKKADYERRYPGVPFI
jgi:hypothetical protein